MLFLSYSNLLDIQRLVPYMKECSSYVPYWSIIRYVEVTKLVNNIGNVWSWGIDTTTLYRVRLPHRVSIRVRKAMVVTKPGEWDNVIGCRLIIVTRHKNRVDGREAIVMTP